MPKTQILNDKNLYTYLVLLTLSIIIIFLKIFMNLNRVRIT